MARDQLDRFLSESMIAKRAKVPAKVVFRATQMTSGSLTRALGAGEVTIEGEPRCDLVAGRDRIATGAIVEKDGRFYFQAKESDV